MTIKVLNLLCTQSAESTSIDRVHAHIHRALNNMSYSCETRYICNTSSKGGFLTKPLDFRVLRRPNRHPLQIRKVRSAISDHLLKENYQAIIIDGLYSANLLLGINNISIPVFMVVHGRTRFFKDKLARLKKATKLGFPENWSLVFVSEEARTYWQNNHPDTKPPQYVIENCIESKTLQNQLLPRRNARAALQLPRDTYVIGTIGRLSKEKNISYLLKAFTELPKNISLCIIGDGNERDFLERYANELGIKERVQFAGQKSNASQYFNAFDCFVMTSLTEGSPLALLEALAAGCDVVCSDIETLRNIELPEECYFSLQSNTALATRLESRIESESEQRKTDRLSALKSIVETRFSTQRFDYEYQILINSNPSDRTI